MIYFPDNLFFRINERRHAYCDACGGEGHHVPKGVVCPSEMIILFVQMYLCPACKGTRRRGAQN